MLMCDKMIITKKYDNGVSLVELIIVIAILAILAGFAIPELSRFIIDSKISKAKADIKTLAQYVTKFEAEQNSSETPTGYIRNKQITEIRRDSTSAEVNISNIKNSVQKFENTKITVRIKQLRELKGKYISNVDELKDPWGHEYKLIPAAGEVLSFEDVYNNQLQTIIGNDKNYVFDDSRGGTVEVKLENNRVYYCNLPQTSGYSNYLYAEALDTSYGKPGFMKINQYVSDSEPVIIYSLGINGLDDHAKKDDIKQKGHPLKILKKALTVEKILPKN